MKNLIIPTVASAFVCAGAMVHAEEVEIALSDRLDGIKTNYCLDVAGGNNNVDISKGLQSHTCYSYQEDLSADQIFDSVKLADDQFFMSRLNVCAQVSELKEGASVGLAECSNADTQKIRLEDDGSIRPVMAENLCFTAAKASRSGRNPIHQIRALSLETCSADQLPYQIWYTRVEVD